MARRNKIMRPIGFEEDDFLFISQHMAKYGMTLQHFVTFALKKEIGSLKAIAEFESARKEKHKLIKPE